MCVYAGVVPLVGAARWDVAVADTTYIEDLLTDTREAIRVALEELDRIQAEANAAEAKVGLLQREEEGLLLALKRHRNAAGLGQQRLEVVDEETSGEPDEEFLDLPRTDAIVRVLLDHPRGLSPAALRDALRERGRDDEYQVVSAALAHLKNQGRVTSPKRGLYVAVRDREEATA